MPTASPATQPDDINVSNTPDNTVSNAVPNTPPMQQMPAVSQPAQPPTGTQPQPNQPNQPTVNNPVTSPQPTTVSNAPVTSTPNADPNADHPAVQRASLLHSVAESLAGGPQYKTTIDPNTGVATRNPVPLSGRQIGLAIALEAISGGLSGLSAKGTNAVGEAGALGLQQGQKIAQQRQQAEQQQDQQANQDYVRQLTTARLNMQMRNLAVSTGKLDQESHAALVNSSAQQLAQLQKDSPEMVAASNVSEQDAMDVKKYPMTDYYRLPDGTIPRMDPNTGQQVWTNSAGQPVPANTQGAFPAWDNTYSVIHRDAMVSPLSEDGTPANAVKDGIALGRLPANWGSNVPADTKVPARILQDYSNEAQSVRNVQTDIMHFQNTTSTGKENSNANAPVMNDPDALFSSIRKDPSLGKAIEKWSPYLVQSGHNYTAAYKAMAAQDPQAAAKILNLYRGDSQDNPLNMFARFDQQQALLKFQAQDKLKNQDAVDRTREEARAKAASSSSDNSPQQVAALGTALANGSITEDEIPNFGKIKGPVQAWLATNHPNLDQSSVFLDSTERKMRDLARNATENLNTIQSTLNARPDLLGVIQGRLSQGKELTGTNDPDLARVSQALDQWALASTGAHGIRSVEARRDAKKVLLNSFKNGPDAVNAAMAASRSSLAQFAAIGKPKGIDGQQYTPRSGGSQQPKQSAIPTGATMKVPGSDGKLHWSDGRRDLGVVQ